MAFRGDVVEQAAENLLAFSVDNVINPREGFYDFITHFGVDVRAAKNYSEARMTFLQVFGQQQ